MKKAIFFDRDGVINSDVGHYYIYKVNDFRVNEGIIESMKLFQNAGFELFVISNQGGIAKEIYKKEDTDKVHRYFYEILSKEKIQLREIYYCPHHSDIEKCLCRKPDSLMIEKALARFNIDKSNSFLIGDSERDIKSAKKAKINAVKIDSNENILDICKSIISEYAGKMSETYNSLSGKTLRKNNNK